MLFIDMKCPRCGRTCGNTDSGFTVRCSCGWTGGLEPVDEAAIIEFLKRHEQRNAEKGDAR